MAGDCGCLSLYPMDQAKDIATLTRETIPLTINLMRMDFVQVKKATTV
jgi:hypothetical protein